MKTILIFTQEYNHPKLSKTGGIGVFYRNYAESLVKRDYKVIVFGANQFELDEKKGNLHLHFFKNRYFKTHFIQNLLRSLGKKFKSSKIESYFLKKEIAYFTHRLKDFIKKNHYSIDIIETHDWNGISLYLKDLSIPYVVRTHGINAILAKMLNIKPSLGKAKIEDEAFVKAPHIIFVSNYAKDIYGEIYNKRGVVINNGIVMTPNIKPSNEIIPYSIFFFGSASIRKGIDIAVNVLRKVVEHYPTATLHIVGKEYDLYQKKYSNKEEGHIVNHGHLEGEQLWHTLMKAHLFIFPSRGETFGLALCEAMALQKSVVASTFPTFQEIITDKVDGFIAHNEEEYCEYITNLFDDESLNKSIAEKAAQKAQHYNFEDNVTNSLLYYQKVLSF